jgi:hypothetical protein
MKNLSAFFFALTIFLFNASAQDMSSFSQGKYVLTPYTPNDGLWGYKNYNGETVIKPKFEFAAPFYVTINKESCALAKYKDKWVIINSKGKIQSKIDADEISLKRNDHAWIYRRGNKYGIINRNGIILTEPIYDFIEPIGNIEAYRIAHFIYKKNDKIGVSCIDVEDNSIFEFIKPDNLTFYKTDMTPININFSENSCLAWGNDNQNKIRLDYCLVRMIENNNIIYKKYNTSFRIAKESKVFTPVTYELDSISQPLKIIPLLNKNVDNVYFHKAQPILPSLNWYKVIEGNNFCRIIKKNGKWGVLFSNRILFGEDQIFQSRNIVYDNILYDSISNIDSQGVFIAYKNDKCGLINQSSYKILDFKFDKIRPVSANYFALQKDNLWGISYLDTIIFQLKYDDYKFNENYWYLKKEDNWGVFSNKGKMLCDFKYNEIQDFQIFSVGIQGYQFAKVIADKKVGLINSDFQEVLPSKYDELGAIQYDYSSKDLYVFVKDGGLYGSVNLDRYKIDYNTPLIYNSIEDLRNQLSIIKERIKVKRLEEERKLAEIKKIEEQRRVEEEERQRKIQMAEEQIRQKELKNMYAQLQSTTINYVSRFLKNPSGASWVNYNGPDVTRRILNESRNYLPNCDNVFATMITVDATNSFGGYIRSTYVVFFKDNYPCHFEDVKAIDNARNSATRIGDMDNMLSLTLDLRGCGCR